MASLNEAEQHELLGKVRDLWEDLHHKKHPVGLKGAPKGESGTVPELIVRTRDGVARIEQRVK